MSLVSSILCLQTLVESGEMLLSDGRRIVPETHALAKSGLPNIIVSHPDFRMMVLANRPGFPFLGNDFFGALGMFIHTNSNRDKPDEHFHFDFNN